MNTRTVIATCAAFRVRADDDSLAAITRLSMRELARRIQVLDANSALWRIAIVRMATDENTRDHVARRLPKARPRAKPFAASSAT